jgi:ubiquinone/menaquinone biosynthesis C-methylase UbiE
MSDKNRIKEMIAYYERRAPWHDQYMSYSDNENMERLFKPVIKEIASYISKKNVIEIACGTGNWSQILAKITNRVLAIDSSPKSLELAREKVQTLDNVNFEIADAYNLENMNDKYDVAFMADFFSHIPKKRIDIFLESLKRVIKPDGLVIIVEMSNKEFFLEKFDYFTDDDGDLVNDRQLPDGSKAEVVKNFYTEAELRELLKNRSDEITYHHFDKLERWLLRFKM